MAHYSAQSGSLSLRNGEFDALRAIARGEAPDPRAAAELRAAAVIDSDGRIVRSLQQLASQLAAPAVLWSVSRMTPSLSLNYRIWVTESGIIGHCREVQGALASDPAGAPILFNPRARFGVLLLQLLDIDPRSIALATPPRGVAVSIARICDSFGDGAAPLAPEDRTVAFWSVASDTAPYDEPTFGVATERGRLAIGQRLSDSEVLLVGCSPEVAFRRFCGTF